MRSLYEDGNNNVRPNTITYAKVLDVHARRGDIKDATKVWEMMKMDYDMGNANAKPNARTYTIIIDAWSKSNQQEFPFLALDLLKTIRSLYEEGNN